MRRFAFALRRCDGGENCFQLAVDARPSNQTVGWTNSAPFGFRDGLDELRCNKRAYLRFFGSLQGSGLYARASAFYEQERSHVDTRRFKRAPTGRFVFSTKAVATWLAAQPNDCYEYRDHPGGEKTV